MLFSGYDRKWFAARRSCSVGLWRTRKYSGLCTGWRFCFITGSANTGRKLKSLPSVAGNAVRFNMEADSLNCSILGLDAKPGTPEFDLFIKEVRNEMTTKAGQKCTAIVELCPNI